MEITQQNILNHYEYRAYDFRGRIIGLVDSVILNNIGHGRSRKEELPLLIHVMEVLLKLLSKGRDAAALTYLLIYAALHTTSAKPLYDISYYFLGDDFYPGQNIINQGKSGTIKLDGGDGLCVTYTKIPNDIGGYNYMNITLWRKTCDCGLRND